MLGHPSDWCLVSWVVPIHNSRLIVIVLTLGVPAPTPLRPPSHCSMLLPLRASKQPSWHCCALFALWVCECCLGFLFSSSWRSSTSWGDSPWTWTPLCEALTSCHATSDGPLLEIACLWLPELDLLLAAAFRTCFLYSNPPRPLGLRACRCWVMVTGQYWSLVTGTGY